MKLEISKHFYLHFWYRYEELERPCFPGDTHLNPRNNFSWVMTDHLSDESVLSIAGEEAIAQSYFSRVDSRIGHLSQVNIKLTTIIIIYQIFVIMQ